MAVHPHPVHAHAMSALTNRMELELEWEGRARVVYAHAVAVVSASLPCFHSCLAAGSRGSPSRHARRSLLSCSANRFFAIGSGPGTFVTLRKINKQCV
jgi:hypothetical protein